MSCRGDGCNEHGHADTRYEFQPTWFTNDSVHESVFPDRQGEKKKAPAACRCFLYSWSRRDSNSPLSDCEPDALPDELRPQTLAVLKSIFENLATGWAKEKDRISSPVPHVLSPTGLRSRPQPSSRAFQDQSHRRSGWRRNRIRLRAPPACTG